jgi:hypothetical protein
MKDTQSNDGRRAPREIDSRWRSKTLLRFIATLVALVAMGIFGAAVSQTNSNFINTEGDGDWPDGMALAPVCPSARWMFCPLMQEAGGPFPPL